MQNPNASVDHPNVILSTSDIESTYKEMQENKVEVERFGSISGWTGRK